MTEQERGIFYQSRREATLLYREGMAEWSDKHWSSATSRFINGSAMAEQALSLVPHHWKSRPRLAELAVELHFLAGNYEDVKRIGRAELDDMCCRFPDQKARIQNLVERAEDPAACERAFLACQFAD